MENPCTWPSSMSPSSFSPDGMVIWTNLAFCADDDEEDDNDCSSPGNCSISSSRAKGTFTDYGSSIITKHVVVEEDQEIKLREELEKEIEKQLEQEIMEGILVLVQRLSKLKAKQILRSLEKFNLEEFLNVLYGSSCDITCNFGDDECGNPICHSGQISPTNSMTQFSKDQQAFQGSDDESTIERWAYYHSD